MARRATVALLLVAAPALGQAAKAPAPRKPAAQQPATKQPATKQTATSQPATKQTATKQTAASQTPTPKAVPAKPAEPVRTVPTLMREVFTYDPDSRRDPFVSLLSTSELRPAITDLKLVGILYDMSGRHPIAILRDLGPGNAQYRVTTGQTLGRMRVASIRPRVVVFTIQEFGLNRQDSLVLGDTTRAVKR